MNLLANNPGLLNTIERGMGILSINSSFVVDDFYPIESPSTDTIPSNFYQLYYGIRAFGTNSQDLISIKNTDFDLCFKSTYLNGLSNSIVVSNNYYLSINLYGPDTSYGLFLDYCTGFKVEENYFTRTPPLLSFNAPHVGVVVNNSGDDPNRIYNNVFDDLHIGSIAQGENRGDDVFAGLTIKCNKYIDDDWDIAVTGGD